MIQAGGHVKLIITVGFVQCRIQRNNVFFFFFLATISWGLNGGRVFVWGNKKVWGLMVMINDIVNAS